MKKHCRHITMGLFLFGLFAMMGVTSGVVRAQEPKRPTIATVSFRTDTVSIVDFGAIPNGQHLNTEPINQSILATSHAGGGTVVVPKGLWLTGPIELQSNINLHLLQGAVLLFTDDFNEYKLIEANWEGQPYFRNQNPISGHNLENVAITGGGVIDGNGGAWRMVKRSKMTDSQWKKLVASGGVVDEKIKIWYPTESSLRGAQTPGAGVAREGASADDFMEVKDFLRPNLLHLTNSKRILIEDIIIQNSPAWNVHPLLCEDLTVRGVTVRNPWYAQNGDGLDVESCKNVLIEDCTFDVGDDAICIKSGRDQAGRDRGVPTENVMIRNNVVYHGHGGFVIGSEMSGGARNIWVEDCTFLGTDIGLRFKTTRGRGGVVEHIYIDNVRMVDIPGEAILFDMYYEVKDAGGDVPSVSEETPQFRHFRITNVDVKGANTAFFVRGLPEMPIDDIVVENAVFESANGMEITEASRLQLRDISLRTKGEEPVIKINNATDITFDKLDLLHAADVLFHLKGAKTSGIAVSRSNLDSVKQIDKNETDVPEGALTIN